MKSNDVNPEGRIDKWERRSSLRELKLPQFDLADALCAQTDPEMFYPEKLNNWAHKAKQVCEQCSIRVECLTWALENDEQYGIWGGLTPAERNKLRGRERRSRAKTYTAIPLRQERR